MEYVSGKQPIVIGKPSHSMFEYIKEKFAIEPQKTLMVGDRCDTDIKFGRDNNMKTLLVGTGIHSMDEVHSFRLQKRLDLVPDFYSPSLSELYSSIT